MLNLLWNRLLDAIGSKKWDYHRGKNGIVMRRRLPGRWEYRALTTEEMFEEESWQSIK